MKKLFLIPIAALLLIWASGCFPGTSAYAPNEPAGFFSGIWHGWIAPISLIIGIFNPAVRIYEVNNTGWWYDLGFYIAVISGFGGIAVSRKRHRRNEQS